MNTPRRQFLKTSAFGTSSLFISSLLGQAASQAEGRTPRRVVFVLKSSGTTPASCVPATFQDELTTRGKAIHAGDNYTTGHQLNPADKLIDRPLAGATLSDALAPLAPFRDRLTILQGLSGQMVNGGHTSGYGALSCVKGNGGSNEAGKPVAETIDSRLARRFPAPFAHLGLSLMSRTMGGGVADSVCYPGISAAGPGKPLPFQGSPAQAHRSLFGSVGGGAAKAKFDLRSDILDQMAADVQRLQGQVAAAERDKLAFHLEAIEDLQRRRHAIARMGDAIGKAAPALTDSYLSPEPTDRLAAHFDLAAGALIAGLTHVVTLRTDSLATGWTGLGIEGVNVHGIGHGKEPEGFENADAARAAILKFQLEQIARLAAKLQSIPEGDGTMLDNTLIVYTSDVGDKHHASNREWPFLLLGDLGGSLKTRGRYLQYPAKDAAGHHTIANWWMTLLHAAGIPADDFGMKDPKVPAAAQKGPLPELLA